MRSLNRIDLFLAKVGKIWKEECPDWRFSQLLVNMIDSDPFYWEEEEFLTRLKKFFKIEE